MGSQIPRGNVNVPSGTNWTPAMENHFIGLLLDQVHKGNRVGYTFNKQAWNEMLALFNANFRSPPHDVNLLKNRYTALSMKFNDIKNLLDRNGFSWDEARRMVVASDHVWDAYIKVRVMLACVVFSNCLTVLQNELISWNAGTPTCASLQR